MPDTLIDLQHLTPSQKKIFRVANDPAIDTVIWYGSVRSGKGVGSANWLIYRAINNAMYGIGNGQYLVGGATTSSFARNNEAYLRDICSQAGMELGYGFDRFGPHYKLDDIKSKFYLFGGDNQRSFTRVQGVSLVDAWIDEATNVHEKFAETTVDRFYVEPATLIMTTNAGSPFSWVKTWMDSGDPSLAVMSTDYDENIHFPESRRAKRRKLNPHTAHFKRMIDNIWAGEGGRIIPIEPEHVVESPSKIQYRGIAVLDPGTAGTTAALLFQRIGPNKWAIVDEYYHIADIDGRRTDEFHLQQLRDRWKIDRLLIDPAGASMRTQASKMGFAVETPNNSFEKGVQTANNALYNGTVVVYNRCRHLLTESAGYTWNQQGTRPVTTPDHLMDTFRYGCHTLMRNSATVLF